MQTTYTTQKKACIIHENRTSLLHDLSFFILPAKASGEKITADIPIKLTRICIIPAKVSSAASIGKIAEPMESSKPYRNMNSGPRIEKRPDLLITQLRPIEKSISAAPLMIHQIETIVDVMPGMMPNSLTYCVMLL